MNEIILVDFEDSFTFNVAQMLYEISPSLKVISYKEMSETLLSPSAKQVLVLGPGPGHPSEYLASVESWLSIAEGRENIFILGICLGHQLLLSRLGLRLARARHPIHGQARLVNTFEGESLEVQFYNSLFVSGTPTALMDFECIKNEHGEILSARWQRHLTYQFHPESVGTNYPTRFLGPVREFLYNKKNED